MVDQIVMWEAQMTALGWRCAATG